MRIAGVGAVLGVLFVGCGGGGDAGPLVFTVTYENVSSPGALEASDGSRHDIVLAPGVWAVYGAETEGALFEPGAPASDGLRALAEEGASSPLLVEVADAETAADSGTFAVLDEDDYEANPIGPGAAVSFELEASEGDRLSLASMFVQSNDTFGAPAGAAMPLFDEAGEPVDGDVTDRFRLWDAGTEVNQEPGIGPDQAPRQDEAGQGEDESEPVAVIDGTDATGHEYPAVTDFLRVRVTTAAP